MFYIKKDVICLAREELLKLDQSIRDCSDRLTELSPLDPEAAKLRITIQEANDKLRAALGSKPI